MLCKARFDTFTIAQLLNTCSGIVMPLQYACICILVIDKYIELVMYRFYSRFINDLISSSAFYKSKHNRPASLNISCKYYEFIPLT